MKVNYSQLFNECRHELELEWRYKAKERIKSIMRAINYFRAMRDMERVEVLATELEAIKNIPIEEFTDVK